MKKLNRNTTTGEKVILIILVIALLGMAYYQLIDKPVRRDLAKAEAESQALQVELDAVNTKIGNLNKMQDELDEIIARGVSKMSSYNAAKEEIALLNDILSAAGTDQKYSLTMSDVTRDGDQIRRNFTLQFTVETYNTMKLMVARLAESEYRCLINDVSCTYNQDNRLGGKPYYSVAVTGTFFETMVGGTEDAGLPATGKVTG